MRQGLRAFWPGRRHPGAGLRPEIVVVVAPVEQPVAALAQQVRARQGTAGTVLYLAADRPSGMLRAAFAKAGVAMDRIHFLDAVTGLDGKIPERGPDVTYVPSPTMLEMLAMRLEQLVGKLSRPHIIVDSLTALALYSGSGPVQQFSHYVGNRMRSHGLSADLIVAATEEGAQLQALVAGHTDAPGGGASP